MTREEAKYAAEVMNAWAEGRTIQFKDSYHSSSTWIDFNPSKEPSFDWGSYLYRIKPEPRYIPFTYEDRDQLRGKWLMHKNYDKDQSMIVRIDTNGVSIKDLRISYQDLFDKYLFTDGSPCGKVIE